MRFGILGPLLVDDGERVIEVPAARQRVVLATLLVHAGSAVTSDALAEMVWDGTPPAGSAATLRTYVMRLRRVLGPRAGGRVVTHYAGYLIEAGTDEVDLLEFDRLNRDGAEAVRSADWAGAAKLLGRALAVWRGTPLADVPSQALRLDQLPGLEQARLQALEWRADALLHLGGHGELAADLLSLAAEHPLRERFHAQLMLALYRCDRQAEALAAYQRARQVLLEELGTEPGPALQKLHGQMLNADPALDLTAAAAASSLTDRSATPGRAAGRTLPVRNVTFTGRGAELARLTALAGTGGISAISGMPGAGKTALAVHAAHLLTGRFPDGQLFVDLHAHTPGQEPVDPGSALAELLTATGADARFLPAGTPARADLWRDRMSGRRALVILDNAASSAQVTPLLTGGDSCLVLVTSRRQLADLPGPAVPVHLEAMAPREAQDMFLRLAPRAADPADAAGVGQLTALAGHLPLAISLLARLYARHPSWTLADLITDTRASLLTLAAEQDSVAASLGVSYRYLDPARQQFFARLGLHPGTTVDRYAAAALDGVPLDEAAGHLDALHAEGLLTESSYRRYGMHDLIRRYAHDLAAASPGRDQAVDRLLDYYQYTALAAESRLARLTLVSPPVVAPPAGAPALPDYPGALAWARAERANLTACIDHAAHASQNSRVVALSGALTALLHRDGPWDEAQARHTAAVAAARRAGDRPAEANALSHLGVARRLTGDYQGAIEALEQALGIYRNAGDWLGQAHALSNLAVIRCRGGQYAEAEQALATALGIYRDIDDRSGQAHALHYLGDVRRQTADYPEAARLQDEALILFRALGDQLGQAHALIELATIRRTTGDYADTVKALDEALKILRDLDDRLGQADAMIDLGDVRRRTQDYYGAISVLEEALGIFRDAGIRLGQANALLYLGDVRRLTGEQETAAEQLAEALGIYRDIGDRGAEAECLNISGALLLDRADLHQARACHGQALAMETRPGRWLAWGAAPGWRAAPPRPGPP
jgi:DNA-binding SARP family transcriptional activator/tetratricopeptide (TPR) repeat protein